MSYIRYAPRGESPRPGNGRTDGKDARSALGERVHRRLLDELHPAMSATDTGELRRRIERILGETLGEEELLLSRSERLELVEQVLAKVLGYGPLEALLQDETITEILVNGPDQVYVERGGVLEEVDIHFRDDDELLHVISRMVTPLGRRIDESSPMVDARLPDGSRINAIIPPLSLVGPVLSIRRFPKRAITVDELIRLGTLNREMADFLRACVLGRLNIVVSGGTSTGKTTVLNVLSSFLPSRERIVTIEDAAELRLQQRHVIPLEARPPNIEGQGAVAIRQLVINALRMRPDRIIVGEVRGGEALDMLQAMNTGHDGSMTTAHANSPRDALHRVETMVLMAGMELPLRAIREQIASAFDLIVQLERQADGSRRITHITEVQDMEGEVIIMQDIFCFSRSHGERGAATFHAMGVRPRCMQKLERLGIFVPPSIFTPARNGFG